MLRPPRDSQGRSSSVPLDVGRSALPLGSALTQPWSMAASIRQTEKRLSPQQGASLVELQDHIIEVAQRGYPILVAGSAFFLVLAALGDALPQRILGLVWIFGMMVIFPTGVMLGALLRVNVITRDNPLGTLGGLVAAVQAFFIPVFIVVYQFTPQYLPLAVGLLGGAHFLPYSWIYRSRAYIFISLGTGLVSLVAGTLALSSAYTVGPLAIAVIFACGVAWIRRENER